MDTLTNKLQKFGLTKTEAEIYIFGLNHSSIGVSELTKKTQINRTTIYHALETLQSKGLCAKKSVGSKLVFNMTEPDKIKNLLDERISILEKQKDDLTELIPLFNLTKTNLEKTQVYHYEGIEGIKLAIEDALYCKNKHWDIISPIKNFFSEFDKDYASYFIQTRKKKNLTSRSLWETTPSHKNLSPEILKERNPRILPSVMHGKFKSVICLYDEKVLIISSVQTLSAILIQDPEFNETMSAVFEGLWSASKEI